MRKEVQGPSKDGQAGETGTDSVRVRKAAVTPLSTIMGCPHCGRPVVLHHTPMVETGKTYTDLACCSRCNSLYVLTVSVRNHGDEVTPAYETTRRRVAELLWENGVTGPIAAERGELVLALTDFVRSQERGSE